MRFQLPHQFLCYGQSQRVVAIPRQLRRAGWGRPGPLVEIGLDPRSRQQHVKSAIRRAGSPADAAIVAGRFGQCPAGLGIHRFRNLVAEDVTKVSYLA